MKSHVGHYIVSFIILDDIRRLYDKLALLSYACARVVFEFLPALIADNKISSTCPKTYHQQTTMRN